MKGSRRLAAVVLHYRTPAETRGAVASLLASRRPIDDIIVVNNDLPPSDHDLSALRRLAGVRWLDIGRNLGFSGGINVGIRAALDAGADRVLLVNSDATVSPDCVERLERGLDSTPGAGIAGPVVLYRSNPSHVMAAGIAYSKRTGRMRHHGVLMARESLGAGNIRRVDAVDGCLMLIAKRAFEAVGLFDEDYFFSFEDLDFCLRAHRAGLATVIVSDAFVLHEGSRTIGKQSTRRLYFAARNHLLFADKSDLVSSTVARRLRSTWIVVLNLLHALRFEGRTRRARLWAVIEGTMDYCAGRVGEGRWHDTQSLTAAQSGATTTTASVAESL
jgi:GT2 family glycosyltransferase